MENQPFRPADRGRYPMQLTLGKLKRPPGREELSLAEWDSFAIEDSRLVRPSPRVYADGIVRPLPQHWYDVIHGERPAVFLRNGRDHGANAINITFAQGHGDLARDVASEVALRLDCEFLSASEHFIGLERAILEIGDQTALVETKDKQFIAHIELTSSDDGGYVLMGIIDSAQKRFTEGLCQIAAEKIRSITPGPWHLDDVGPLTG